MNSDETSVKVNDRLTLYKRGRSSRWQARLRLDTGEWHRFSTGTGDLEKAKEAAQKEYYTAEFRSQNKLPQSTRKFRRVAEFAKQQMREEIDAGGGRVVFKDYITAIDRYLVPFFGRMDVASIKVTDLHEFDRWRTKQLGRNASHSTINTHNSALNRVFDQALQHGWITKSIRPTLLNKGKRTESRGSFTKEEYTKIYRGLRKWHEETNNPKTRETREVLRNYVLVLANTGARHGTEALNLKWKNVEWIEQGGEKYLALQVSGKTGEREIIARDRTRNYLDRQRDLNPKLADMSFDELLAARVDDWVFKTRSGTKASLFNLIRNFRSFLEHNNLLYGSDGKVRTLYSLRHFYTTMDLQRGVSTHVLSRQLGNSTTVVDQFYSKLSPRMNAPLHSGRDRQKLKEKAQKNAGPVSGGNAVAEKAFEMLSAGQLREGALLAAVSVGQTAYQPNEQVTMLALEAFETKKLSEDGLLKLLNGTSNQ
ncbi:site-specific integrase [uncultured Aliiroseovarius sp.]|uniref:tyrosine-type recombinase/integrase n=1 Tax=uncultured Aliiroseovarius sp. TaxID=1658783 RepID=UPI00260DE4AA|nr:site-specific integrase [uncultured Aliiroseovarius sp.]